MVVISSVLVLISAVSLHEYYSARNWQQVTSPSRNDVVFENRNQKYGAYVLRRDYDRKLAIILLSFTLGLGAAYGSFRYFKEPVSVFNNPPVVDPGTIIEFPPKRLKDVEPDKPEKPKPAIKDKPDAAQPTIANPELVVTDNQKDTVAIIQDELTDVKASATTTEGGNEGGFGSGEGEANGTATEPTVEKTPDLFPDTEAEYPGGASARTGFLYDHLSFPEEGLGSEGGKCFLRFVVSKDGEVSSVQVMRGIEDCPSCNAEAKRVISAMPRWKPAIKDGQKVDSYFFLTVNFKVR